MAIPVHKLVCGNCGLREDRKCSVQGDRVDSLRLACSQIHGNFEDRGFGLERVQGVDLAPILVRVDTLMEKTRMLDRQFIIDQKKDGTDGTNLIGCYWYQFWDSKKKVWKVPSLAWVKGKE